MEHNTDSLSEGFTIGCYPSETSLTGEVIGDVHLTNKEKKRQETKHNTAVIWNKSSELLKKDLDHQIYTAWIKPLIIASIDYSGSQNHDLPEATFLAPNKFCCEHIKRNYGKLISSALAQVIGATEMVLNFRACDDGINAKKEDEILALVNKPKAKRPSQLTPNTGTGTNTNPKLGITTTKKQPPSNYAECNLNPKYNFSNFVIGSCNQFAHAVSLKVSENPGGLYNPLFLYGGVGLGKTHLANAIGNAAFRRNKKVLLVSSETFVTELITALRSNQVDKFKAKMRSVDMLIVDDIQFIIGKERTQEEFFHTFNELYNRHKQIVITSDRIPQELTNLEERLRTRFACGLSADIQIPDFETRVAILCKKAEANNIALPSEVAGLLAEKVNSNIRELEGALNKLQALCAITNNNPNLALAEEVLKAIAPAKRVEISTEIIQKTVASRYSVSLSDMLGKRRTSNIAFARQVAMFLCRKLTSCSYPEIGAFFGGRDHSTAVHACKTVNEKMKTNPEFKKDILAIERLLIS